MDFQLPQDEVDVDMINEDNTQSDISSNHTVSKPPSLNSEFVDPTVKLDRKPEVNYYKIVAGLLELAASDDIPARKKFHLQQNCSHFTNNIVLNSIKTNRVGFEGLRNIFLQIFKSDPNHLSLQQLAGIVNASLIFKGNLWSQLPIVIRKLKEAKRNEFIGQLKSILVSNGYIDVIVDWICENVHKICEDTLRFVDIINAQQKTHEAFTTDVLVELINISQIVDIPETKLQTFIDIFHLLKGAEQPFTKLLNWTESLQQASKIQKLSLSQFGELVDQLMNFDNL